MEPPKATASAIINLAEQLEDASTSFYQKLARKFPHDDTLFTSFVEESKKNKVLVTRTYRETITDALEACFCFEDLNPSNYEVNVSLTDEASYPDALRVAVELEDKTSRFYLDVAELSKSLLATIPVAFKKVAERRNNRKRLLKSLLEKVEPKQ